MKFELWKDQGVTKLLSVIIFASQEDPASYF